MKIKQIGLLMEVRPKNRGGFILVASNMTGSITRLHTFDDYTNILSTENVFEYAYSIRDIGNGSNKTFNILDTTPKLIGNLIHNESPVWFVNRLRQWYVDNNLTSISGDASTDNMVSAAHNYLKNPKRYHKYDEQDAWDRLEPVKNDIESLYDKFSPGRGTEFQPTYNPKYDTKEWDKRISDTNDKEFFTQVDSVTRRYRNKARYLTLSGKLQDSQLSRLTGRKKGTICTDLGRYSLNTWENSGIKANIDSVFAQVILKERHIAEFYVYFTILTYMRKTRCYPNIRASNLLVFLKTFLDNSVMKRSLKGVLIRLKKIGMLEIEGNPQVATDIRLKNRISLLNQQSYVRKCEKAWNAKNCNSRKATRIHNGFDKDFIFHTDKDMQPLTPKVQNTIQKVYQPYFDLHFPKTAKMDTGFINLVNGSTADQRAFLYELVVSSWGYPVCRTRISMNLLFSPSTQRHYERKNRYMGKQFNHLEIPNDMVNRMGLVARENIFKSVRNGGKFKQSRSGKIYRQEGNTYNSNRIEWKNSQKCSRLRLSSKHIKLWRAGKPVFSTSMTMSGKIAHSQARFMPVNDEVCTGRPLSKTYISKKVDIQRSRYFAMNKNGVGIISTDPQNWSWFEPHLEYDDKNGDFLVPLIPSLQLKENKKWDREPEIYNSREAGKMKGKFNVVQKVKELHNSYSQVVF